jgi:hypothetical protein
MKLATKQAFITELLTSISLVGCFLNILSLVHDLYLFSDKGYLAEYLYLITLSVSTVLCLVGILKLREGKREGFALYLYGQIGEFVFYTIVLLFITIPEYKERIETDSFLASASFVKNIAPLLVMTLLHYGWGRKVDRGQLTDDGGTGPNTG